jgi:hypothetical protein
MKRHLIAGGIAAIVLTQAAFLVADVMSGGAFGLVEALSKATADADYVNVTGDTMTGKLSTVASATTGAGLTLPHGAAPTSPVNGDLWTTTAGLYARINSGTVGPLIAGAYLPLAGGTMTGPLTLNTSTTAPALDSTVTLSAATGDQTAYHLKYTTNKAAGNDTGLLIDYTRTASSGVSRPFDIQVGGSRVFHVNQLGSLTLRDIYSSGLGQFAGNVWALAYRPVSSNNDLVLDAPSLGTGNSVVKTADAANAFLIGDSVSKGSLTAVSSNGTAILTKNSHGLTLLAGDLAHITGATTAADKGFYQVESSDANTITLDRALAGSDNNVAVKFYRDVLAMHAGDGTNGMWMRSYARDKPLQIGGHVRGATTRSLAGEDVLIPGQLEVDGAVFLDSTLRVTSTVTLDGAVTLAASRSIGAPSNNGSIIFNQNKQTPTTAQLIPGTLSNHFMFNTWANKEIDYAIPQQSNPTLFFTSQADATAVKTRWGSLSHDGTTGAVGSFNIATGAGDITLAPASGQVSVTGNLAVTATQTTGLTGSTVTVSNAQTGTGQSVYNFSVLPTYNQPSATGAINQDLRINRIETSLGTTPGEQSLIWAGVGGVEKFRVGNGGAVFVSSTLDVASGLTANSLASYTDATNLTLSGTGTGIVHVNDNLDVTGNLAVSKRTLGRAGADVASANDITLGDGNFFVVTGVTQIQRIAKAGWTAGSRVLLQFAGIAQVAHATAGDATWGSIHVTGGSAYDSATDSMAEAVYDGGTWFLAPVYTP